MVRNLQLVLIVTLCIFFYNFIEVNHYFQFFIFGSLINSALRTLSGPVPYGCEITQSIVCGLLSSIALREIFLTFCEYIVERASISAEAAKE